MLNQFSTALAAYTHTRVTFGNSHNKNIENFDHLKNVQIQVLRFKLFAGPPVK